MDKIEAKEIVFSFITEMNKWEKKCNEIEDDETLNEEEQFNKQKKLVTIIFEKYCTPKKRKMGLPNIISYGFDDCYEYDPKEEKIIEVFEDIKDKLHVETFREDPLEERFQYILVKNNDKWLIDTKKSYDKIKEKWVPDSL